MDVCITAHTANKKMMITFTCVANYSYTTSKLYVSLYFEELMWITFNFLYKLNYNISL